MRVTVPNTLEERVGLLKPDPVLMRAVAPHTELHHAAELLPAWDSLRMSNGLPRKYFPASLKDFSDGQYGWDTMFISLGVRHDRDAAAFLEDSIENTFFIFNRDKHISNSSGKYSGRSQPPFQTSLVLMQFAATSDLNALRRGYVYAIREYCTVWMKEPRLVPIKDNDTTHNLSRYFPPGDPERKERTDHYITMQEAGKDNTLGYGSESHNVLPIELNSLLYLYETDFALISRMLGEVEAAAEWQERAQTRQTSVNRLLWDDKDQVYRHFHFPTQQHVDTLTSAIFYPLYVGMASPEQAAGVIRRLPELQKDQGLLVTTDMVLDDGNQWGGQNAWPTEETIAAVGLQNYGRSDLAARVVLPWMKTMARYALRDGTWPEKISAISSLPVKEDDRYDLQLHQLWSMGVYADFYHTAIKSPLPQQ